MYTLEVDNLLDLLDLVSGCPALVPYAAAAIENKVAADVRAAEAVDSVGKADCGPLARVVLGQERPRDTGGILYRASCAVSDVTGWSLADSADWLKKRGCPQSPFLKLDEAQKLVRLLGEYDYSCWVAPLS